eukprot:14870153-Alexandrium_andersonii.AAC.1
MLRTFYASAIQPDDVLDKSETVDYRTLSRKTRYELAQSMLHRVLDRQELASFGLEPGGEAVVESD